MVEDIDKEIDEDFERMHKAAKLMESKGSKKIDINEVDNGKPKIVLPKDGRLHSKFIEEISGVLKTKKTLFYRVDAKQIVEVLKIKHSKGSDKMFIGFEEVTSNKFITVLEKYVNPGHWIFDKTKIDFIWKEKSINNQMANVALVSSYLRSELLPINRIFTVPIPIVYNGFLVFPRKGYDARFGSWLSFDTPIIDEKMSLEEAKGIIDKVFCEFCFKSEQDRVNAIASLLTPFLRGLYSDFTIRTPIFFYIANRERCGKDFMAGINGIVYEGVNIEEPAISDGEKGNSSEEFRKKILSLLINGRKRFHSSNNKGFINNAAFEQFVTSRYHSDRLLGKNETLKFPNEMDFSLSGNMGVTYTPDFGNRCRFIRLFLDIEDANSRKFNNPDLHGWCLENRDKILSALFALVRNWFENGKKDGSLPFSSFYEWAKICGGIMESAGYGNPCVQDKEMTFGGDEETMEMKALFELAYEKFQDRYVKIFELRELARVNEMFSDIFDEKNGNQENKKFGMKISKFEGRILSGIKFYPKNQYDKGSQKEVKFQKVIEGT